MGQQNGSFEFIKNIIAGAGIVIVAFLLSIMFVGFVILIPFVLVGLYGMFFIRPTLHNPRDIRTCWFSIWRFYIVTVLKLGMGIVIFPVLFVGAWFGFGLIKGGLWFLGGILLGAMIWSIQGYGKLLFVKGSIDPFTLKEGYYMALRGRY